MQLFYVKDWVAVERVELPPGVSLSQCRHAEYASHCVDAPDDVQVGWIFDGNSFSPPPAVTPTAQELIAYAMAKRYEKEVGGVVLGGVPIATDDRSKLMITGARVAANSDPDWTTVWQGSDGNSYPLTSQQMIGVSDGVQAFVSECFATFADVKSDIEDGTVTTFAEIDAAFA